MLQSTGSQRIRHDLVTEQQQQKDDKEEKSLLPHEQQREGRARLVETAMQVLMHKSRK